MSATPESVQVTLEMMGDVIEKRVMEAIANQFSNLFSIDLQLRDTGLYPMQDGSYMVTLQVSLMHRWTNNTIQSQPKTLYLKPDAWGKPTLKALG